jgi:hypothetical protein
MRLGARGGTSRGTAAACLGVWLVTVSFASSARADDWDRKLDECRSVGNARAVMCPSGLDPAGAAARAACEAQNRAAMDAAERRIEDCRAQVQAEQRAKLGLEREKLEEKMRRDQADAAAKAKEAAENPPCIDGPGKCAQKAE